MLDETRSQDDENRIIRNLIRSQIELIDILASMMVHTGFERLDLSYCNCKVEGSNERVMTNLGLVDRFFSSNFSIAWQKIGTSLRHLGSKSPSLI